jgi:TP901-1 family phage major tail protein
MATKGVDFIIKIGSDVVACQRGGTLDRSADTIDVTCKSSTAPTNGEWKSFIPSLREWSISADGIYVVDDDALLALEEAFIDGTAVTVEFSDKTKTGTTAGTGDLMGWSGSAIITSFPIESPYDDALTYSIELQGAGELQQVKVTV